MRFHELVAPAFFVAIILTLCSNFLIAGKNIWTTNGPYGVQMTCVEADPCNPQIIYAGTWYNGIYKTADRGLTWRDINSGLARLCIFDIAVDPIDPLTIYVATYDGVFKSINGGETWSAANAGLVQLEIYSLAIDPINPRILYAGTYSKGLFKSMDGGNTWISSSLQDEGVAYIAIAPSMTSTILAVIGTSVGPLAVYKSVNAGDTWIQLANGTEGTAMPCLSSSIAVDPTDQNVLYVGTWMPPNLPFGCGVLKSTDGGNTWRSTGLEDSNSFSVKVNPAIPSNLYALAGGVFRSVNNGASWIFAGEGLPYPVGGFSISKGDPTTVYAVSGSLEGVWSITFSNHGRPLARPKDYKRLKRQASDE